MDPLQRINLYATEFQNIIVTPPPAPPNPVTTLAQDIMSLSFNNPTPSQPVQSSPPPPPPSQT